MATGIYYPNLITFSDVLSEDDENEECGPYENTINEKYFFDMSLLNTTHGLKNEPDTSNFSQHSATGSNSVLIPIGNWKVWHECESYWIQDYAITGRAYVETPGGASAGIVWTIDFNERFLLMPFFAAELDLTNYPDGNKIIATVSNEHGAPSSTIDKFGYAGNATIEFLRYNQTAYPDGEPNISAHRRTNSRVEVPLQINPRFAQGADGDLPPKAQITPARRSMEFRPQMQQETSIETDGQVRPIYPRTFSDGLSQPPFSHSTNYSNDINDDPPPVSQRDPNVCGYGH